MRKTIRTVAVFTLLCTMFVGCQKEEIYSLGTNATVTRNDTVYMERYVIDGVAHRVILHGDAEHSEFIYKMLALAEEGHEVTFYNESKFMQNASKEVITFTTQNKDDAFAWASDMENNGYSVTITYDPDTDKYICVARN